MECTFLRLCSDDLDLKKIMLTYILHGYRYRKVFNTFIIIIIEFINESRITQCNYKIKNKNLHLFCTSRLFTVLYIYVNFSRVFLFLLNKLMIKVIILQYCSSIIAFGLYTQRPSMHEVKKKCASCI